MFMVVHNKLWLHIYFQETGSFNQEYADQSQSAMIHQIDCLLDQSTTEISPSSRSFYREFNNGGFSSNQSTSGEYQNGTLPYSYPAHDHPKLVTNHTTAGTNESQGTHFFDEQFDPYNTLESIWDLRNPTYYGIPSHSNTNGLSLNSNIVHESYLNQTRTLEGPEDFIQSRQPSTSAFVQKTFEPERSPQEINFPFVNTEAYEEVIFVVL